MVTNVKSQTHTQPRGNTAVLAGNQVAIVVPVPMQSTVTSTAVSRVRY